MSWNLQRWLFKAKEGDINRPVYSVKDVPDTFHSDKEYYETLLSHVAEELRAQIHTSLLEAQSALVELTIDNSIDKKRDLLLVCSCAAAFQPADVLLLCQDYPWAEATELSRTKYRFAGPILFGIVDSIRPNRGLEIKVGAEQEPKVRDTWQWWCMKVANFASLRRVADALQCGLQSPHMLDYLLEDLYIGTAVDEPLPLAEDIQTVSSRPPATLAKRHQKGPDDLVPAGHVLHESPGLADALLRRLNIPQVNAIVTIVQKQQGVSLLQGPPGTGKTTTIMGLLSLLLRQCTLSAKQCDLLLSPTMLQTLQKKPRVMLTAPSNVAVAQMASRLLESGALDAHGRPFQPFSVLIGVEDAIDERSRPLLLANRVAALCHALQQLREHLAGFMAFIRDLDIPLADESRARLSVRAGELLAVVEDLSYFEMSGTPSVVPNLPPQLTREIQKMVRPIVEEVKGRLDSTRKVRLGFLQDQLKRFQRMINDLEFFAGTDQAAAFILRCADAFFCTLSSAGQRLLRDVDWHTVVVDEAAQAPEAEILVALKSSVQRLVLVGDPQQLSATVISQYAAAKGYGRSMMQRLMSLGADAMLLRIQYRMHPEIAAFPSAHFYNGRLINGPSVLADDYQKPFHEDTVFQPFVFLDVEGVERGQGMSLFNAEEAQVVAQLVGELLDGYGVEPWQVAVVSPYNAQVRHLKQTLRTDWLTLGLEVKSVDGCQGAEYDIVLFSAVRTSPEDIGFLRDVRRLNVALTRAKYCLVVVGHAAALGAHPEWGALVAHAWERWQYHTVPGASLAALPRQSPSPASTGHPPPRPPHPLTAPATRDNTVVRWAIEDYLKTRPSLPNGTLPEAPTRRGFMDIFRAAQSVGASERNATSPSSAPGETGGRQSGRQSAAANGGLALRRSPSTVSDAATESASSSSPTTAPWLPNGTPRHSEAGTEGDRNVASSTSPSNFLVGQPGPAAPPWAVFPATPFTYPAAQSAPAPYPPAGLPTPPPHPGPSLPPPPVPPAAATAAAAAAAATAAATHSPWGPDAAPLPSTPAGHPPPPAPSPPPALSPPVAPLAGVGPAAPASPEAALASLVPCPSPRMAQLLSRSRPL